MKSLSVYLLLAASLMMSVSVFGQEARPVSPRDYERYLAALVRLLRQNPSMNPHEISRRAAEEARIVFPAVSFFERERPFTFAPDTRELVLGLPVAREDVVVRETNRPEISVLVQVISSNGAHDANSLLEALTPLTEPGLGRVHARIGSYKCYRSITNGSVSTRGGCYHRVLVELPIGSRTQVRDAQNQPLNQIQRSLSSREAVDEIAEIDFAARLERLRVLYRDPAFKIEWSDWGRLMEALDFSERRAALELIMTRETSIPVAVAQAMLEALNFSERFEVFCALAPKVPRAQRIELFRLADRSLSASEIDRVRPFVAEMFPR